MTGKRKASTEPEQAIKRYVTRSISEQQGQIAPGDRPLPELHDRDDGRKKGNDDDGEHGRSACGLAKLRSVKGEEARGRAARTLHG